MSIAAAVNKNDFSDVELAAIPFNTLADHYGADLAREQLQLEHESYVLGEERFRKMLERQEKAEEFGDSSVTKPLIITLLPKVTQRITDWLNEWSDPNKKGRKPIAYTHLKDIKPETLAFITIKVVLNKLAGKDDAFMQPLAYAIGSSIEDEARFGRIRELEMAHFKKCAEENLNKRRGTAYRKAFLSVVEADMLDKGLLGGESWGTWNKTDVMNIGISMLEKLIEATGLVELREKRNFEEMDRIVIAEEYVKAMATRAQSLAGISPMYQPCVVPPKPWVSITGGGYWANGRKPTALIRTHTRKALYRYEDVYMPEVYKAINYAQETPWRINRKVLAVVNELVKWKNNPVKDMPSIDKLELPQRPDDIDTNEESLRSWKREAAAVYRKDEQRKSRYLSMSFALEQANKFSNKRAIYFPYNMDWRGRVYALPMFNPQGNDMVKGLLTLAKGKPIGKDGFYWLKIHGANTAGVDKVTFPERIKFIEDNHDNIMQCAESPLDNLWWTEQDSPFCFLAFCFEYAQVTKKGLGWVCSLPIALDGSCSGIQHFSAMLRDDIGGRAVNLLPSETVQDIYGIVADKVNEALKELVINGTDNYTDTVTDKSTGEIIERYRLGEKELARQWLEFGVTRSVTKRSVMTLAYGSKEYGFRDQVLEDTIRPAIDSGKGAMFTNPSQAAGFMAKRIWEAVSVTVVAAVGAMKWLQSSAKLLAAEVKDKKTKEVLRKRCAVHWVTPDGFPVWQEYRKPKQKRVHLMFLGSYYDARMKETSSDCSIDAHKQESGISPNFVHSQDGNHLRMTVVYAREKYNVESFALIHDSFGTIPADVPNLFKAVRETMVNMYENNDVLADFYEQFADQLHESQLDKMPALPPKGKLNLQDILKSDFAFS